MASCDNCSTTHDYRIARVESILVGSLPVVENGRVVGIITETDLLRRICQACECSPECAEIVVSFP